MIFPQNSTDKSWVAGATDSDFPLQNLPYGVFHRAGEPARVGVAIGDSVLDLATLHAEGMFDDTLIAGDNLFDRRQLNDFLAAGRSVWSAVRRRLVALLAEQDVGGAGGETVAADRRLARDKSLCERVLIPRGDVNMLLPCWIGAYVDFYSSKQHATNVGTMFRGEENALPPNWLHLPIGYHGRSSSVVVSGTDVRRPFGQLKFEEAAVPEFSPTRLLDFELELGFLCGPGNEQGTPIAIDEAADHIFGMVLVNDWSARDIQKWEYAPLGPFLGKSFATSISPWIVAMDALQPFRTAGPHQDPPVLPYLRTEEAWGLKIELEVLLRTASMSAPQRIAAVNFEEMYWTIAQQLAHLTSNGANIEPGDLCASGTVSGSTSDSYGSMLELSWRGSNPITLENGESRSFLEDSDEVIMRGCARAEGYRVGFGEVRGTILPAERR